MLFYAILGGIGLVFLVSMLLAGDLFGDHGDVATLADLHADADGAGGGPSFLSTRVMAAFMTAFGAGGMVARYFGLPHVAAAPIGVGSGFVLGGIVYQFAKLLHSQQASSEVQLHQLVGQSAHVTVGIPAGGVGQVTLTFAGQQTTQIARSVDGTAIQLGAAVVIAALRGDTLVVVPEGAIRGGA